MYMLHSKARNENDAFHRTIPPQSNIINDEQLSGIVTQIPRPFIMTKERASSADLAAEDDNHASMLETQIPSPPIASEFIAQEDVSGRSRDSYMYPIPCAPSLTINYPCNPYGGDCHIDGRVIASCASFRSH